MTLDAVLPPQRNMTDVLLVNEKGVEKAQRPDLRYLTIIQINQINYQ